MAPFQLMGIVNVTPDSFSDGGQFLDSDAALRHIETLIRDGADMIDIGAQSTRPGSKWISIQEELSRLTPVLSRYRTYFSTPLSLDTVQSETALFGLSHGVSMLNDVSGATQDPRMLAVAARYQVPIVLMHSQGPPETMQQNPTYVDVVSEVYQFLAQQVMLAQKSGVSRVIIDPGIGFGKTLAHTLTLLNRLDAFIPLAPVLVGLSRKSFIAAITGELGTSRLEGTLSACVLALSKGTSFFRVHDVASARKALQVASEILGH